MSLQAMETDPLKITLRWKDITIEIPITEEQRENIIQRTMILIHGDQYSSRSSVDAPLDFLFAEEKHLRKLLLQLHENRRILEQQKAQLGVGDVSLRITNELAEINKQIGQKMTELDDVLGRVRAMS